jgi:AraC-like DNA-binding protein
MIQSKFSDFGGYSLHSHPFHEIGVVLRGKCVWNQKNGRTITMSEGQAIWIPPNHLHKEQSTGRVQLAWVGFTFSLAPPAKPFRPIPLRENLDAVTSLIRQIEREQNRGEIDGAEICSLALRQIFLMVRRADLQRNSDKTSPEPINSRQTRIVRSIAAHFDQNKDRPLSLEEVAQYHNLSAPHLSVLFKKHYRMTPTSYRLKGRLAHAKELLSDPRRSIKEIASACGFTDAAHFCREFKRLTGKTPGMAR